MISILELIKNQPVAFAGIVQAAISLLVAFGVPLTVEQKTETIGLVGAILLFWTHQQVTPTNKPVVPADAVVTRLPAKTPDENNPKP